MIYLVILYSGTTIRVGLKAYNILISAQKSYKPVESVQIKDVSGKNVTITLSEIRTIVKES